MRAFVRAAWPVLAIVVAAFSWRAFAGAVPLLDLRYEYAFVAVGLAGVAGLAAERPTVPRWLPGGIALFVAMELAVSLLHLEPVPSAFNRFEHFGALFLFATLALGVVRLAGVRSRGLAGAVVAAGATTAGFLNEWLEFRLRPGTPFLSDDTRIDLVTNTLAIACALAFGLRAGTPSERA